jgi:hypothetical protein
VGSRINALGSARREHFFAPNIKATPDDAGGKDPCVALARETKTAKTLKRDYERRIKTQTQINFKYTLNHGKRKI